MRCAFIPLIVAVLALSLSAQESAAAKSEALAQLGLPAAFAGEVSVSTNHFQTLGVTVTSAKAIDPVTGETVAASWDADGRRVDLSALRQREITARKLVPAAKLHWKLKKALEVDGVASLPVMVWMDFPAAEWDRRVNELLSSFDEKTMTREEYEALEAQAGDYINASVSELTSGLAAQLSGMGVEVRAASTGTPVLAVTATVAQIYALASLPEVDTLYLDSDDKSDYNESARQTHRTVHVHESGVNGRGADIGMLEDNRIDENHPYLTNVVSWFDLAGSGPDDHIQATSGCAASRFTGRIGSAPGANLYSANAASYSDTNVTLAADWLSGTSAIDIMNGSFGPNSPSGVIDYSDRLFDYKSRFFADSYVMAAGNSGLTAAVGNVGWNIIAVGAHSDGNDGGNWDNDAMASFSSAVNPTSGCEKPNVAACGVGIDTFGDSNGFGGAGPWLANGFDGTSFASPFVAGMLANGLQVNINMSTPEPAMAALMATAWHNIEGSSRLSGQDGAGGAHGYALVNMLRNNRTTWFTVTPASFTTTGYHTYNIFLQRKDKTRVCIAWSSNADSGYTTDVLDADLDLAIYAGQDVVSGTSLGSSSSFNNNFEIVEFTPQTTGWYTVRINDYRFDGTSERVGVAWSQKTTDTSTSRLMERNVSNVDPLRTGPVYGNRYWLDINAPHSPSTTWLTTPGTVGFDGTAFSNETWTPVVQDLFTLLWFDNLSTNAWPWRDYVGVTNSNGYGFTNRMDPIWNLPAITGMDITHIGYLIDPAYPDTVREITKPQTIEFLPPATQQTVTIDGSVQISLPFSFPFYGQNYTTAFVNANGNVTFTGGDTDFTESSAEMLSEEPRIALFWDDFNIPTGGTLTTREVIFGEKSVLIDFVEVVETGLTTENTGRITLFEDGRIRLQWRECATNDCIVGLSPGGGISANGSIDLSSYGFATAFGAIYEVFTATGNPFDLKHPGVPGFSGPWHNDMTFTPSGSGYRIEMNIEK